MTSPLLPVYPRLDIELVSAQGCWLTTVDGRRILDLYGGHAVCPLGHGHPELVSLFSRAYGQLDFYSNSLHLRAQVDAAEALLRHSEHLRYVHFTNSGTEANEAALHLARRLTGRRKIQSFDCSFHGRTLASLAASGLPNYRQRLTVELDPRWHQTFPFNDVGALRGIDQDTAAVLCESVPSLAGVRMPLPGYYAALAARCREVGALLIFDEVQGGMGRLGRWFAYQLFDVKPDMVTLAKSLAAGYPAGALLTTAAVGADVRMGEIGTTFGGGPVACQAITTVVQLIEAQGLVARTAQIYQRIAEGLQHHAGVEVRGAGCLIGIESLRPARVLRDALLAQDVMVGLSDDPQTIRLLPPYVLGDEEIDVFLRAMDEIAA